MDASIQRAEDSGMENVATIMEVFKGNILQDLGLNELHWDRASVVVNITIYIGKHVLNDL